MDQIPNIQKNTFCTTAKENEALRVASERGLTSHEEFMTIMWMLLTSSSVCPTCCWKERNREWNDTSHHIAQSLLLCAPAVPHTLAGEWLFWLSM